MKKSTFILLSLFQTAAFAKTICTMTFNSSDERRIFQKELQPLGHKFIELVPENKDPFWLIKSCQALQTAGDQCDSLLISGHFGGLFFGEQRSTTMSLAEMLETKKQGLCPAIFEKPQSVFLMGCNTLSGKTPDHRSVSDYLRVLVGDGFPLDLAENVAAARYLSFGQSMSDQMQTIFNNSKLVAGFESTGPLGVAAAPLLTKAFQNTPSSVKQTDLISKDALKSAFAKTNLRVIEPSKNPDQNILQEAVSKNSNTAQTAWLKLLEPKTTNLYFNFILENKSNSTLKSILQSSPEIKKSLIQVINSIYNKTTGLAAIQRGINAFALEHQMIDQMTYLNRQALIVDQILESPLDYVRADQICNLFEAETNQDLINFIKPDSIIKISESGYSKFLMSCAGRTTSSSTQNSKSMQCLTNRTTHDWACLTENEATLDIDSCKLAKSRNSDPENADDMMWYCYSKMLDYKRLSSAQCLELTHGFSILGNRLKMNWNCQNRL